MNLPLYLLAQVAPFELPPLPYAAHALEPAIDRLTMTIHHEKHHQAYVNNLNRALAGHPEANELTLRELLRAPGRFGLTVRYNAGAHFNHTLFWECLAPTGQGGTPRGPLAAALQAAFGGLAAFQEQFREVMLTRYEAGWIWLMADARGQLAITVTLWQDNPLMGDEAVPPAEQGTPLLGLDVYEHAYYLQYQSRRAEYVTAFWQVVNWRVVADRYAQATSHTP
ncbi:superoxide dismutase [Hymenobacter sp.]|uniref:superoxide dismutase n=1 Tax=Hymenobacter sp. TaxID=1898978 RepID=UPI00286D1D6C|nr:superoxide dismutase [Hymenobacter sp.]